jgi:hypothetical protein
LGDIAKVHRGIEWKLKLTENGVETGNRQKLVRAEHKAGFELGVPPKASVFCYTIPDLKYLDMRKEGQKGDAYKLPWNKPKVFLNAVTKSRRGWRIAAFPDHEGIPGYQNVTAVWPLDYGINSLAAILNGPVANAYVATREGKRHVTIEVLNGIPVPDLTLVQVDKINTLVNQYVALSSSDELELWSASTERELTKILKAIDAIVLDAYNLPPRLERRVLDFFNGQSRAIPFSFGNYFPLDFEPCIPLSEYISPDAELRTAKALKARRKQLPQHVMDAIAYAASNEAQQ